MGNFEERENEQPLVSVGKHLGGTIETQGNLGPVPLKRGKTGNGCQERGNTGTVLQLRTVQLFKARSKQALNKDFVSCSFPVRSSSMRIS